VDDPRSELGRTFTVPIPSPNGHGACHATIIITHRDGRPWRVLCKDLPEGISALGAALAEVASAWLQQGADPQQLASILSGHREGHAVAWPERQTFVLSLPDALSKLLQEMEP
jgi:hypothetical protein